MSGLICTLDGAANILPDVGKAILRSESTQTRILEGLTAHVKTTGGDGVLFAWQGLRGESEVAYLRFASVYKDFQQAADFERELGTLHKREPAKRRTKA